MGRACTSHRGGTLSFGLRSEERLLRQADTLIWLCGLAAGTWLGHHLPVITSLTSATDTAKIYPSAALKFSGFV